MGYRGKAYRRHQDRKKKARVREYWVCHDSKDRRVVGMVATTPKCCSCYMCGNFRATEGPTLQEVRHAQDGVQEHTL